MAIHFFAILSLILLIGFIILIFVHAGSASKNKERLEEANARIEKVEQSRNELMSNLSHELRTPINTIMGMSELLKEGSQDAQVRMQVQAIQSTGRELLSKISDLLDYAQITSEDAITTQEEAYLFTSTISDVVSDFLEPIAAKGIELIIDLDNSVPAEMIGDEPKLRRVMTNILSNAVKFTNSGCIAIHISARKEQYGVNLKFEVRDTGRGMKQEEINRLFDAFYQGDSSLTRSVGGIGLGLAISFAIIRSMGGFLTVSSELEKGTRIAFTVPQRVVSDRPVYQIDSKRELKPVVFIEFEKFKIPTVREEYKEALSNLANRSGAPLQECRTVTELKRFKPGRNMTHLVVGLEEYLDNEQVVDNLAELIPVSVFVPRGYRFSKKNNLHVIEKPFYGLPIINMINGVKNADPFVSPLREGRAFKAPGIRALVVDDNRMNLIVMNGLLKKYEIESDSAHSGFEALRMLDEKMYDLIFMDHMMPEMDGVETLRRIRQRPDVYSKEIPVVAVSANATGNAKERYLNAGFIDFISKPIDNLTLDNVLRRLIPSARRYALEEETVTGAQDVRDDFAGAPDTPFKAAEIPANSGEIPADSGEIPADSGEIPADSGEIPADTAEVPVKAPEIDMEQALMYCAGDMELYMEIVDSYIETHAELKEKLQRLHAEQDWKNYAVEIHALKGTSRTIGALELGDKAERLEKAAKSVAGIEDLEGTGGLATLTKEHAPCLALYDLVISKLGELKA